MDVLLCTILAVWPISGLKLKQMVELLAKSCGKTVETIQIKVGEQTEPMLKTLTEAQLAELLDEYHGWVKYNKTNPRVYSMCINNNTLTLDQAVKAMEAVKTLVGNHLLKQQLMAHIEKLKCGEETKVIHANAIAELRKYTSVYLGNRVMGDDLAAEIRAVIDNMSERTSAFLNRDIESKIAQNRSSDRIKNLEKDNEWLSCELKSLKNSFSNLDGEKCDLKSRIAYLENELNASTKKEIDGKNQFAELQSAYDRMVTELRDLKSQKHELQMEVINLTRGEDRSYLDDLECAYNSATKQNEELTTKNQALQTEIEKLKELNTETAKALNDVLAQLEK